QIAHVRCGDNWVPGPVLESCQSPRGPLMIAPPVAEFLKSSNHFGGGFGMKKLLYVALLAIGVIVLMAPPAMAQEEKPFTLHGEARFGYEYHANAQDFDKNNNADQFNYWPYRVRIAAEGKFTKGVTAWIEFQNGGT